MKTYLIEVFVLPNDTKDDFSFHVSRDDEYTWGRMVEYLERLQRARVIDNWEATEVYVHTAALSLCDIQRKYGRDLDAVEEGYEEHLGATTQFVMERNY